MMGAPLGSMYWAACHRAELRRRRIDRAIFWLTPLVLISVGVVL